MIMNRSLRKGISLRDRDSGDEEDGHYERRALIDDEELCDDDIDLLSSGVIGIRQRQSASRAVKSNLGFNYEGSHEMKNLNNNNENNRARDSNGDSIVEFTTYEIQPGDSLRSICLRFACSINVVKRLNGLMSDQDFYGLRCIKLPMGKMGLLEDILKTSASSQNLLSLQSSRDNLYSPKPDNEHDRVNINSPGCALSVMTNHGPKFKPLLSPGHSSDKINQLNKSPISSYNQHVDQHNNGLIRHSHSQSFSSLRDFSSDININMGLVDPSATNGTRDLPRSFIKPDIPQNEAVDDLIMTDEVTNGGSNVHRVFHDLDYHVEKAKAAVENYDQRAAELVDRIDVNGVAIETRFRPRVSKIPELFFCSENFGLNLRKLLVIIFVVCLLLPLIYLNQATEGHGSQL